VPAERSPESEFEESTNLTAVLIPQNRILQLLLRHKPKTDGRKITHVKTTPEDRRPLAPDYNLSKYAHSSGAPLAVLDILGIQGL